MPIKHNVCIYKVQGTVPQNYPTTKICLETKNVIRYNIHILKKNVMLSDIRKIVKDIQPLIDLRKSTLNMAVIYILQGKG